MPNEMTPSDQEALAAARAIKASQSKRCVSAILTLVIGIAISLFFPPAAICVVIGLFIVERVKCSECQPHEHVLGKFAEDRNWHYQVQTELRSVKWQKRRVRFYCSASLLSINDIADRLISNDFAPRMPQPTGEVPRKQSDSRQRPFSTGSPSFESTPKASIPITDSPQIPPAGWNPTPDIIRATTLAAFPDTAFEIYRELPAPLEQQPPAGEEQANANANVKNGTLGTTAKRSKVRNQKLKEEAPQSATLVVDHFAEGAVRQITLTTYERDPRARRACLAHHGSRCCVCGTDFGETYGELGEGYIHVHHLRPLSKIADNHEVNPITDLIPVCPNCHVMLHQKTPPLLPETLRQYLIGQGQIKTPSEKPEIKKQNHQQSKETARKQTRAAVAKKPRAELPVKPSVRHLAPEATVSYEDRIPSDRIPMLAETVKRLVEEGVTTPELLAETLDRINPRSRKFSNHFWDMICAVNPSLYKTVDWHMIYQIKDIGSQIGQA